MWHLPNLSEVQIAFQQNGSSDNTQLLKLSGRVSRISQVKHFVVSGIKQPLGQVCCGNMWVREGLSEAGYLLLWQGATIILWYKMEVRYPPGIVNSPGIPWILSSCMDIKANRVYQIVSTMQWQQKYLFFSVLFVRMKWNRHTKSAYHVVSLQQMCPTSLYNGPQQYAQ